MRHAMACNDISTAPACVNQCNQGVPAAIPSLRMSPCRLSGPHECAMQEHEALGRAGAAAAAGRHSLADARVAAQQAHAHQDGRVCRLQAQPARQSDAVSRVHRQRTLLRQSPGLALLDKLSAELVCREGALLFAATDPRLHGRANLTSALRQSRHFGDPRLLRGF